MEPVDRSIPQVAPEAHSLPAQLSVVVSLIYAIQAIVLMHSLSPGRHTARTMVLVVLWGSAVTCLGITGSGRPSPMQVRFSVASALGVVVGEWIAYFVAVPWDLTCVWFELGRADVEATMFLRLGCVLLALRAWKLARSVEPAPHRGPGAPRAALAGGLAFGLLMTVSLAFVPAVFALAKGHRPALVVEAEYRAAAQLGPDYAGYRYFVRSVDQVFRTGESVTINAAIIAYSRELGDARELDVTWKTPWQ
jgi:hypothetical protein